MTGRKIFFTESCNLQCVSIDGPSYLAARDDINKSTNRSDAIIIVDGYDIMMADQWSKSACFWKNKEHHSFSLAANRLKSRHSIVHA